MGLQTTQVDVWTCDGCGKRIVADPDNNDGLPTSGVVGTVILGYDAEGEARAADWYAHVNRCIKAAVEAVLVLEPADGYVAPRPGDDAGDVGDESSTTPPTTPPTTPSAPAAAADPKETP